MRNIQKIILHCSATTTLMDINAETIREWHVKGNGWADIGYNYVIKRDGTLENGRDLDGDGDSEDEIGAHAAGFNTHSLGICLVGGIDHEGNPDSNFTRAQYETLFGLHDYLKQKYPKAQFIGHRDISSKACPSLDAKALFN